MCVCVATGNIKNRDEWHWLTPVEQKLEKIWRNKNKTTAAAEQKSIPKPNKVKLIIYFIEENVQLSDFQRFSATVDLFLSLSPCELSNSNWAIINMGSRQQAALWAYIGIKQYNKQQIN